MGFKTRLARGDFDSDIPGCRAKLCMLCKDALCVNIKFSIAAQCIVGNRQVQLTQTLARARYCTHNEQLAVDEC
jgi:hypothetical protein